MNLNIFKQIIPAAALVCSLAFTACVNDLHVENINPQQNPNYTEEALLNKIYSSFVLTGQQGPAGKGDIQGVDEGFSDYYRNVWELQEFTTDEASWVWIGDPVSPNCCTTPTMPATHVPLDSTIVSSSLSRCATTILTSSLPMVVTRTPNVALRYALSEPLLIIR